MIYQHERDALVTLSKQLADKGYLAGTGGNIMMRLSENEVAVTPSAKDYHELKSRNICVLSLQDLKLLDGDCQPSVESAMHAVILKKRPELRISIHTHQPIASACTLLNKLIRVPDEQRANLGRVVPMISYAPSGTSLLVSKVNKAIRPDSNAYLLRNHGVICLGVTSDEAVLALDNLETLAKQMLLNHMTQSSKSDKERDKNLESLRRGLSQILNKTGPEQC